MYNLSRIFYIGGDKMKKMWLFVLAIIMSVVLSACGSEGEAGTEAKDGSTADEAAESVSENEKYADAFKEDILILTEDQAELSQESYDFIVANYSLFPATTDETIAEAKGKVDTSVTIKHLNKNPQPYFQTMTSFQGSVVSIEETPLENGEVVAVIHVLDDEWNSYQVLMYKSTGDILEEDSVQFWGVPVGASSFENVSGGATNVQNFFGSHIEKIN